MVPTKRPCCLSPYSTCCFYTVDTKLPEEFPSDMAPLKCLYALWPDTVKPAASVLCNMLPTHIQQVKYSPLKTWEALLLLESAVRFP